MRAAPPSPVFRSGRLRRLFPFPARHLCRVGGGDFRFALYCVRDGQFQDLSELREGVVEEGEVVHGWIVGAGLLVCAGDRMAVEPGLACGLVEDGGPNAWSLHPAVEGVEDGRNGCSHEAGGLAQGRDQLWVGRRPGRDAQGQVRVRG